MVLTTRVLAVIAGISMLSNALPFDTPRQLAPRQKKYSVINVDGGSTQAAQATTVIEATKTVEVINPGPTVTEQVTTIVTPSRSSNSAAPTTSSTSSSTSILVSTSIIIETPKPTPVFVTVTVPQDDGPTQYYDNGMWHTYYRIKSFAPAVATFVPSPPSYGAPNEAAVTPSSYGTWA